MIKEKLNVLKDKVLVCDMDFGVATTAAGVVLLSDDGKTTGIHPRWAKVFAIGPDQKDVEVGDYILLEHGRWGRGMKYETENGDVLEIRLADKDAILMVSPEKPSGTLSGMGL